MHKVFSHIRQIWLPLLLACAACALVFALAPTEIAQDAREPWSKGDVLRVGAPEPVRQATVISPYGPGVEYELVGKFCQDAPCEIEWVAVEDKAAGFAMLHRGVIDVLVGFWGDEPQIDTDAEADDLPRIVGGKAYAHFNPIRITGANTPPTSPAQTGASQTDAPASLGALGRMFSALFSAPSKENTKETQPFPVFSLLAENNDESAGDIVLLDPASYALWLPFMGDVGAKQARAPMPYRWFWRVEDMELADELTAFWQHKDREAELKEITERYFGFLPRTLRQRDIMELADTLAERLPKYEKFILNASRETGVPPLLLVAIIYQESRFNPDAVSETKVRGIMQLTTATARMLEVDRRDPEQCIMGGARYVRDLFDRVGEKAKNDWDRWFMALAAYNQGMSNLNRTIRISQDLGGTGDNWADLKRAFPLSTTCRGLEARSFVEKIRYYNFILHGLVALAPTETQDFAPLHGLALSDGGS